MKHNFYHLIIMFEGGEPGNGITIGNKILYDQPIFDRAAAAAPPPPGAYSFLEKILGGDFEYYLSTGDVFTNEKDVDQFHIPHSINLLLYVKDEDADAFVSLKAAEIVKQSSARLKCEAVIKWYSVYCPYSMYSFFRKSTKTIVGTGSVFEDMERLFNDNNFPNDRFPKPSATTRNKLLYGFRKEVVQNEKESQVARIRQNPRGAVLNNILDILDFGLGHLDVQLTNQRIVFDVRYNQSLFPKLE